MKLQEYVKIRDHLTDEQINVKVDSVIELLYKGEDSDKLMKEIFDVEGYYIFDIM